MSEQRHDLEDGKYTLILSEDGYTVTALRYGEPWREFVGDKFISLLVQEFFERRPQPITDAQVKAACQAFDDLAQSATPGRAMRAALIASSAVSAHPEGERE